MVRRRGAAPRARARRLLAPLATTLSLLVVAELVVRGGLVLRRAFPAPTEIVGALYREVQLGSYWTALWHTIEGWGLGLGLGIAIAVPVGIVVGTTPVIYRSLRFVIDFLRPIPSIAVLPLFIIVFGITLHLKVYLVALGAFWPLFFQTLYGVQDVDPVQRDTARAYRLNPLQRFVFVSLAGATPYVATGLRISATYALVVAIGTEFIVGLPGIGVMIYKAQYAGDSSGMYAFIVTSGVLGLLIAFAFNRIERVTLRWHPSQRGEVGA